MASRGSGRIDTTGFWSVGLLLPLGSGKCDPGQSSKLELDKARAMKDFATGQPRILWGR